MKVLWLSHLVPYPPKGGVLIRSFNLIKELGGRAEVDLLMFNQRALMGSYFNTQEEGEAEAKKALSSFICKQWILPIENDGCWAKRWLIARSFFSLRPYTIAWLDSPAARKTISEIMAHNEYDIIHFDTISLDVFRDENSDVKIMLDHHNIESHMMGRRAKKEKNLLKKLYFWWEFVKLQRYEKAVLGLYCGHIVCSKDDKQRLLELDGQCSVEVIPNGIAFDGRVVEPAPQKGKLLFIGGLSWYPNADAINDFVTNIAPELRKVNVDFELDVVGKNGPKDLQAKVEGLSDIRLHGYVDNISGFYRDANVYK